MPGVPGFLLRSSFLEKTGAKHLRPAKGTEDTPTPGQGHAWTGDGLRRPGQKDEEQTAEGAPPVGLS